MHRPQKQFWGFLLPETLLPKKSEYRLTVQQMQKFVAKITG
jgi:hypothetical protein